MATDESPSDDQSPFDEEVPVPDYSPEEMNLPDVKDNIKEMLAPLELEMYEEWRLDLARWAFDRGRKPSTHEGYARSSMKSIFNRIDNFTLWVFGKSGFRTSFTPKMLTSYWQTVLAPNDNGLDTNRRTINSVQIILKYDNVEWSIPDSEDVYATINKQRASGFTDWLRDHELRRIRHAALRAYGVPDREDMTDDEEDEWAAHLSQRLRKPKNELNEGDWGRATSHKIPSLVYVSCDVGFRPCEIERARMSWFVLDEDDDDLEDDSSGMMIVPKDEDSKDGDNYWRCYLSDESVRLLRRWRDERDELEKYDGRDAVWLTREENPYSADSLSDVMQKLMDEAGINPDNRETGWYMIRRGVGTSIGNKQDIDALMSQLRINSVQTARRYVQDREESVRKWFDERGL